MTVNLKQIEINAARPRRRVRWPLRGGRRLRWNNSPFFAVTDKPRRIPFKTDALAMRFARHQMYRAGWGSFWETLFKGKH